MTAILPNTYSWPDAEGRFGPYGGRFVAETLMPLVHELTDAYAAAQADPTFQAELDQYLEHYVGRPSPLTSRPRPRRRRAPPRGTPGNARSCGRRGRWRGGSAR